MSFYITLPSNASTDHAVNTQSNYTTHLSSPLYLTVPYEVALVEFAYREFISFDIGTIKVKFPNDVSSRDFQIYAYDNEPLDHLINRLNYEILDYYIKLECFVKAQNANPYDNQTLFVKNNWTNLQNKDALYIENYQYFKQRCPLVESRKNNIIIQIPDKITVEFSGHAANLFQTNEKVLTANHEFTILSELLNFN